MRHGGEEVVDALGVGADKFLVERTSRERGPGALKVGGQSRGDDGGRVRRAVTCQYEGFAGRTTRRVTYLSTIGIVGDRTVASSFKR